MRELLVVFSIGLILAAYQIYITIAKHEPWAWWGVGAITVLLLFAAHLDAQEENIHDESIQTNRDTDSYDPKSFEGTYGEDRYGV